MRPQKCPAPDQYKHDGVMSTLIVALPLIITLQTIILCKTLYYEWKARRDDSHQFISIRLRVLYIILQLLGLACTFMDFLRHIVDPFTEVLHNSTVLCDVSSFTPRTVSFLYYTIYLYQIHTRTELSFRESFLALSRTTTRMLLILLVVTPVVSAPVLLAVVGFTSGGSGTACKHVWNPTDFSPKTFYFCYSPMEKSQQVCVIALVIWASIANLIYGSIFCFKLNILLQTDISAENDRVVSSTSDDEGAFYFKHLIIKSCILTVAGSTSTIVCYSLWIGFRQSWVGVDSIFVYIDLLFNVMVIGLMFGHNDKYYKSLCKPCILCCFLECDRTNQKVQQEALMKYVNHDIDLDLVFKELEKTDGGMSMKRKRQLVSFQRGTVTSMILKNESALQRVMTVAPLDEDEEKPPLHLEMQLKMSATPTNFPRFTTMSTFDPSGNFLE